VPFELVPQGTHIDFIGKRHLAIGISLVMLLAGAVAVPINGVKMGIDFQGGTEMQVLFAEQVNADEGAIRKVVGDCGIAAASVVRYGEVEGREFLIRFQEGAIAGAQGDHCPLTPEQVEALAQAKLAGGGGGDEGEKGETIDKLAYALTNAIGPLSGGEPERVEFVGPRVGSELRAAGLKSLLVACVLILIYIAIGRFRNVLITLLNLPFALVGGILAVVITGGTISVGSMVGFVTLFGITVRNSIMLISHYKYLVEAEGMVWNMQTAIQGAQERLPSIIMTALVTALAMLPIAFNSDNAGREIMGPMASIIIGEALVGVRALGFIITGAIMGSVLFRLIVALALRGGLNPNDLKLVTAVFVFGALVLPSLVKRRRRRAQAVDV